MNFYIFHVKSRLFKKPPKNDWFEARVEIDSANKKLTFTEPRESNELYEEYETGEPNKDVDASQPVIEPSSIEISEFRPPKIKGDGKETSKKGVTTYRLELPGRARVGSKSLKMSCKDHDIFAQFVQNLKLQFSQGPDGAHSASILSLAQLGRHQSSDSNRQANKLLQPQRELLEFAGGEYATVRGAPDDDADLQSQLEMKSVSSAIYESFEPERSCQMTFDYIRSDTELPRILQQFKKGDPVYLYISNLKLELLNRDKCPVCDWPMTQIRCFKFNETQVLLDVGTRTVTGRATLSFNFDSFGPSAPGQFVQMLSVHLSQPPKCACCQGLRGPRRRTRGLSQDQSADSCSDDSDEDATEEENDNEAAPSDLNVCSNPSYFDEKQEQLLAAKAERIKSKLERQRRQRRQRILRQTKMQSAEPDYYSSVRKPQTPKPVPAPPTFGQSQAIPQSQPSPTIGRPMSLIPVTSRQMSSDIGFLTPLPPPVLFDAAPKQAGLPPILPPREASGAASVDDNAYETIDRLGPPEEYADDPTDADVNFVMEFSDKYVDHKQHALEVQQQQQQANNDKKPVKVLPKKNKK